MVSPYYCRRVIDILDHKLEKPHGGSDVDFFDRVDIDLPAGRRDVQERTRVLVDQPGGEEHRTRQQHLLQYGKVPLFAADRLAEAGNVIVVHLHRYID